MKTKKSGISVVAVLTAAGLANLVFGGVAKADVNDWGYLFVENNLNSNTRRVNIVRDDEFISGATDGYDNSLDIPSNSQPDGYPNCYSVIPGYNLWDDFRPNDSNLPYTLKLSFSGTLTESKPNWLEFDFYLVLPEGGTFGDKQIIFQSDRLPYGPVVDINRARALAPDPNKVNIPLKDVPAGTYNQWTPYGSGTLDIGTRILADLNDDKIVNFLDFALFANDWKNHLKENPAASCVGNISGPNGIPDANAGGKAVVDELDLSVFSEQWLCDPNTIAKAMQFLPKEYMEALNKKARQILDCTGKHNQRVVCRLYQNNQKPSYHGLSPDMIERLAANNPESQLENTVIAIKTPYQLVNFRTF